MKLKNFRKASSCLSLVFIIFTTLYFVNQGDYLMTSAGTFTLLINLLNRWEYNKEKRQMLSILMRAFDPKN